MRIWPRRSFLIAAAFVVNVAFPDAALAREGEAKITEDFLAYLKEELFHENPLITSEFLNEYKIGTWSWV